MGIKEFSFKLGQAEVIKTNRTTDLLVKEVDDVGYIVALRSFRMLIRHDTVRWYIS